MRETEDIKYMQRCLDLALKAQGTTYPNPMVGSVIVNSGRIIGEGFHLRAGEPHAEVIAINAVRERELLPSSVLYVNLEPCSHFGKTPPCTDLIISAGIKKVVIGTKDTSEKVAGRGIDKLKKSGCKVVTGILEKECRWINRRFFSFNEKKRPYIILKWAQSADGFLDSERSRNHIRQPLWITGKAERILVHKWRSEEQAILAGAGTIRADDPKLNVRDWTGKDPLRLILSSSGALDENSALFSLSGTNVVFTRNSDVKIPNAQVITLSEKKASSLEVTDYLFINGIQSVLIEGGAEVLRHFITSGIWDEARVFKGKMNYEKGTFAPSVTGSLIMQTMFSESVLEMTINEQTQVTKLID